MKLSLQLSTTLEAGMRRHHVVSIFAANDKHNEPVLVGKNGGLQGSGDDLPTAISLAESLLDELQSELNSMRMQLNRLALKETK